MKAVETVTKAVDMDEKQNYEEAYHLYCEALQYFVPIITAEDDLTRRLKLQDQALNYLQRAEEIKASCQRAYSLQRQSSQNSESSTDSCDQPSTSTAINRHKIETALKPSHMLSQLCEYKQSVIQSGICKLFISSSKLPNLRYDVRFHATGHPCARYWATGWVIHLRAEIFFGPRIVHVGSECAGAIAEEWASWNEKGFVAQTGSRLMSTPITTLRYC